MSTQLRLVEPPEPSPRPAGKTTSRATSRRGRTVSPARTGRRSVSWGDWHLDAGTRRVGRAGVARARLALEGAVEGAVEAAVDQELRAS